MMRIAALATLALLATACTTSQNTHATTEPTALALAPFSSDRISVEVRGSGPDVILIPGLASSRSVWDRTADQLDANHRVHLVQVGGFAGAPAGANATGAVFPALVEELARYIQSQQLRAPSVIGHSMGGAAALKLAADHPSLVGRLLIVDALPFFSVLMNPAATEESARATATAVRDATLRSTADQYAQSQTAGLAGLVKNSAARTLRAQQSAASDKAVVAQVTYDVMTTDLRPSLGRITAPVTVLYPYDQATYRVGPEVIEPVYARSYAGLPGVKLVRVDDSLHFIMDDQPDLFAREVEAFLASR